VEAPAFMPAFEKSPDCLFQGKQGNEIEVSAKKAEVAGRV